MDDTWRTTYDHHLKQIHALPEDGEVWLTFAKFLEKECTAPIKALRAYQNAHRLLGCEETLLRLGSAYVDAAETKHGIELLRAACIRFPSAHAFAFLANAQIESADYVGARTALDEGIRLDPKFDELYFLYGESYRRAKCFAEAIEWYEHAKRLDPSDDRYWQELGHCELRVGKTENAITSLSQAVKLNPEAGWAWQYLAVAHMKNGEYDAARASYETAIAVFPEDDDLRERYRQFLESPPIDD